MNEKVKSRRLLSCFNNIESGESRCPYEMDAMHGNSRTHTLSYVYFSIFRCKISEYNFFVFTNISSAMVPKRTSKRGRVGGTGGADNQAAIAREGAVLEADAHDNKLSIRRARAISPLVALLGHNESDGVEKAAASALWNLVSNDDNKVGVAEAGAIAPLVALMSVDESAGVKEAATWALRYLAYNKANTVAIFAAGAVTHLIALLREGEADTVKEAAAGVLKYLARNDKQNVTMKMVVPPLVALLREGEADGVREAAAGALRYIALNSDSHVSIAQARVVDALVALLSKGEARPLMVSAARALYSLAENDTNKVIIQLAGAIPKLTVMLSDDSDTVKQVAAEVLSELAHNMGIKFILEEHIHLFVTLLRDGRTDGVKEAAADTLYSLSLNSTLHKIRIAQAGAIPTLVALLRGVGCERVQQAAMFALEDLSHRNANLHEIERAGAIAHLVSLQCDSVTDATKETAAEFLLHFINNGYGQAVTQARVRHRWAMVRALVHISPYAIFWHMHVGEQLCAPGGKWAECDRTAFEEDFSAGEA